MKKRLNKQLAMFFDGGCPLCRREVEHYRRLDRNANVRWIDISSQEEFLSHYGIAKEDAMARLHVLDDRGRIQTGAVAFVSLWSALPHYAYLARVVRFFGLTPVLERLYTPFARWRLARRCTYLIES